MINYATMFTGGLSGSCFALKYEGIEYRHVFGCEIDKYARQQYIHFHGEPENFYEDVANFDATPYNGKIDLLIYGSSCQNFSLAGNRKGLEGDKSKYFRYAAIRHKEMMPKNFIFENVKGLLSSNGGRDYKEVCNTFRDMGYHIHTTVMNTKEFGVPQNRERVFIVGFLDEVEYHKYKEPVPFKLEVRLKDLLEAEIDQKYFLSDKQYESLLNPKYESMSIDRVNEENGVCNCLTTMGGGNREPKVKLIGNCNPSGNGMNGNVYDDSGLSPTLTTNKGEGIKIKSATKKGYEVATENDSINFTHPDSKTRRGRVGKSVAQTLDCACNQGVICEQRQDEGLRFFENNICGTHRTIDACGDKRVIQNYKIRKLTPRECFRLQGMKDDDIDLIVSDTQAYKIAGNAISVNVMQYLLRSLYSPCEEKTSLFDF